MFTDEEWLDAEYYFDIRWYYAIGYGSYLSPYLGLPWVKTTAHLLEGHDGKRTDIFEDEMESASFDGTIWTDFEKKHKLPKPQVPPNATHSQLSVSRPFLRPAC